ncbi:MAG: outer membrane protein assembly factor BamA [Candidatus Marinimicrobia bacterium]|nr:outer membrane protein assembly factor BamA [Candidatus Neomarinimicrobiota bacterium]|tara:strand:- start:10867 stop:13293 length:2427 start_codon:yes stop_codon:yes gene_type:complete
MKNNVFYFLSIFFITIIFSQVGINIDDIKVQGNIRLSESDILRISRLQIGDSIDMEDIQKAIRNLSNLNQFNDIQIFAENTNSYSQGVILKIVVEEHPLLKSVEFRGNKKLSEKNLIEKSELVKGTLLSPLKVFTAVQNILTEYRGKHYHNVKVDTVTTLSEDNNYVDLTIIITENKKTKIKEININGNKSFSDWTLLFRHIKATNSFKWYLPFRGEFNKDKWEEDKLNLESFYKKKGYRDFYIKEESIDLMPDKKGLSINISIYEGPQYYYKNISFEGNLIHSNKVLSSVLNISKGDIYDEEKFQIGVYQGIYPLYRDGGYFYVQIEPVFEPVGEDSLNVKFNILENQKVKIRKVHIAGNNYTNENVIRRYLKIYPGEIFSQTKFEASARDIFILNYFENVIPNYLPYDEDEIDLIYEVIEKRSGVAQLSMGYNAQMGLTGGGSFQFPNFRGTGRTISFSYQRGINNQNQNYNQQLPTAYNSSNVANYQSFSFSFTDPRILDTPNLIGLSASYSERGSSASYLQFDVKQVRGSARLGREFKWPDRFFSGSWSFSISNSRYFSESKNELIEYFGPTILNSIETAIDGSPYFSTSGLSFTQTIHRDSRNHPEFPSKGSKFIWTSTFSGSFLGGDEDYHKHRFDFNFFSPIIKKVVLHSNMVIGAIKQIPVASNERSIINPNAKFVMGGSGMPYGEMLRGYADNTVGPYGTYRPKGGNIMLKYSIELRLSLAENPTVYALAFAEAGNVWENFETVDTNYLKRSLGVGIRTYMPMLGMLGFDAGYGFDDTIIDSDSKPQGWNYHFLFGMPL